jgi:tetratricopeptide (TPR) repeat protein
VRMRLHLLAGERRQAEALYLKSMELGGDFQTKAVKGELFRQIAGYLLTRGEASMGLQWIKKAVIQFQGSGNTAGERIATSELGSILLAEGKFEEALEYFALAEQSSTPLLQLEDVVGQALRGVALFLLGNLSRAQNEVDRGLARARFLKNREWELALQFLRARILFEFGFYSEAVLALQECLATETLYECPPARQVLYAWLGRSYAYLGATDTALRVLEQDEETWERHLFLAETRLFREEYLRALEHCDRALAQNKVLDTFPGPRPKWLDGFWDVECRCLVLLRQNALSRRLIQALQGYLWSLEGSGERGIEQLYSITRGERLPEADPYQSLYNFLYAESLPEVRKDELDDSLTVLNKALKLLQQRASRIEDSTLRWRYLNSNRWNARLFSEAKRKKLL